MHAPNQGLGPNFYDPTNSTDIPLPVTVTEGAVVENIYTEGAQNGQPEDVESVDRMGKYLAERLRPTPPMSDTIVVYEPVVGRRFFPKISRTTNGYKDVTRLEMDGWIISPKVAAAVTAGLLLFRPLVSGVLDIKDEIGIGVHNTARIFNPKDPYTEVIEKRHMEPGPTVTVSEDVSSISPAGRIVLDEKKIQEFVDKLEASKIAGGKVIDVIATGGSSDDYGTPESIGRLESPKQDMADNRADAAADALDKAADKARLTNLPETSVVVNQDVLSPAQQRRGLRLAKQNGFTNLLEAIDAVQAGQPVGRRLEQFVTERFIDKRYTKLTATIEMPGEPVEVVSLVPREVVPDDRRPADPDRDYPIWPLFLPPIPRLRRYTALKQAYHWVADRTKVQWVPRIIENMHDKAWVRLLPRALKSDNTLVDHPWKDTRKFLHLMREDLRLPLHPTALHETEASGNLAEQMTDEDVAMLKSRIGGVLRADYEKEDGEATSARMMFIDHVPSAEHLDAYSMFMKVMASLQGGSVGVKIPDIFVYPSTSAGVEHNDPRKIALGIDEQESELVLGLCTPIMGQVELHVRTDITNSEDLLTELYRYLGPIYTLAHEVAGHGVDTNEKKQHLLSVRARGVTNAHIPLGSPWKNSLGEVGEQLEPLLGRDTIANPVLFEAVFELHEGYGGKVTTPPVIIRGDNPMIAYARSLRIYGFDPTLYAGANQLEQFAETGAQVATSILIPGSEAGADIQPQVADNGEPAAFATGYSADAKSAEEYRRLVGAVPGVEPLTFENMPRVTTILTTAEADPLLGPLIKEARETHIPLPDEMIAILTELRSRKLK